MEELTNTELLDLIDLVRDAAEAERGRDFPDWDGILKKLRAWRNRPRQVDGELQSNPSRGRK